MSVDGAVTGSTVTQDAVQGSSVVLTIDAKLQKVAEDALKNNIEKIVQHASLAKNISNKIPELFSVMNNSPIAFAVIEVTFDDNGHGMDFIFRYCNDAMLKLEGLSADDIVNKSFYEVFKDSNKKWMVSYADIALNGNKKIISYYLKKSNRKVLAYCYQPYERFCACSLIDVESTINVAESFI